MPAISSHPRPRTDFRLSEREVDSFHENGFLVVKDALLPEEIEALRSEATSICRGDYGAVRGTLKKDREIPGVVPVGPETPDEEVLKRYLCIHFPHKISDYMLKCLAHPVMQEVLSKVIGPNVKCMQSMLFIKSAGKPGQAWHQDEYYIPTRDRSLTGGWIAMDRATTENGCLWVIPGSHKSGVLWPQKWHADTRFDCAGEAYQFPYKDEDAIPVEVEAGSIVYFNGHLLHRSLPNRAKAGYRRCLVNHYMSAESLLPWHGPKEGESVATADMRDIVMVCGKDPYAWKGVEDLTEAHVRSTGEGGCGNNKYNLKQSPGA
jgi:ectoine hydroxylase-related dioxygenase (phytanoyl-CoA dioxygenase family)